MKLTLSENEIQKTILEYLAIKEKQGKCYCFRAQAGQGRIEGGGYMKFGRAGNPDIVCCVNGKFVGFEIKDKQIKKRTNTYKNTQSEAQNKAERAIRRAGGEYYLIRDLESVVAYFNIV